MDGVVKWGRVGKAGEVRVKGSFFGGRGPVEAVIAEVAQVDAQPGVPVGGAR